MPRSSDVIVIGGGLIGCASALRLAQRGAKVQIFDRGEAGCEASSAGAGMLAPQGETTHPDPFYELCAASRELYPKFARELEQLTGCTVGLRDGGSLLTAFTPSEAAELGQIYEAQESFGLAVEKLSAAELRLRLPQISPDVMSGLFFPSDGSVDNERLVLALKKSCSAAGVVFHNQHSVVRLNSAGQRIESVSVQNGSECSDYSAQHFVLAAGAWSRELAAPLDLKLPVEPCRGQMIELDGVIDVPCAIRMGHFYCVPRSGGRLVAGSTMEYCGFNKTVTVQGLLSILQSLRRLIPDAARFGFRRAWAGLRPDTPDHLPILGYARWNNLIFATGHFRNGILLTPITARLITELVTSGTTSLPIDRYSPLRFSE